MTWSIPHSLIMTCHILTYHNLISHHTVNPTRSWSASRSYQPHSSHHSSHVFRLLNKHMHLLHFSSSFLNILVHSSTWPDFILVWGKDWSSHDSELVGDLLCGITCSYRHCFRSVKFPAVWTLISLHTRISNLSASRISLNCLFIQGISFKYRAASKQWPEATRCTQPASQQSVSAAMLCGVLVCSVLCFLWQLLWSWWSWGSRTH